MATVGSDYDLKVGQHHYLKQNWFIVNRTTGNQFAEFESKYNDLHTRKLNVVYKMVAILSLCQQVQVSGTSQEMNVFTKLNMSAL